MIIRVATKDDVKSLLDIENECFDANNYPLSKHNFLYHIKSNNKIFVCTIDNTLVGYVLIFYYKKSIRLYSLATKCAYRGQKIGYNLVMYVQKYATSIGKESLSLEVRVTNTEAIEFYTKIGFVKTKILKDYYTTIDGIKMVKKI